MNEAGDTFLFQYEHNGAKWNFHLWAEDYEDARARLRKISHAEYLGNSVTIIPAVPGAGLLIRLACWLRNSTRRLLSKGQA